MSVGVVVAVHGFAPYLQETLESLLAQDPAPAQVIVVDDGSPVPVALSAPGVGLVRRARRGGPAAARATGESQLGGELKWVAFCDADDAWTKASLSHRLEAIGEYAVCFGRVLVVGPDGRPTGERWAPPAEGVHGGEGFARALYRDNPICLSSAIVRRDALAAAGGLSSALRCGEDWDLWLRLAARGERFACVPEEVVRYRRHPGGLTADVASVARARLEVHRLHAGLVDEALRREVRAGDLRGLARGLVRERRYGAARAALREAAALGFGSSLRERALAAVLAVPGARRVLGRRDPYRP
ncbi:MAG TPA: glycosyltransferase family 2 protein [Solirubrobacteraceae bacterium]|jgi:glycosyltransferase involved in cell wall biosynthesis|nr:glycosyltransferase family 2 protein [Solirubrobacteraceae bacterium]